MKIKHEIKSLEPTAYFLNGVRVWYGITDMYIVHVGRLGRLEMDTHDAAVHTLAKALHLETGQAKINRANPEIMEFLTRTKCI